MRYVFASSRAGYEESFHRLNKLHHGRFVYLNRREDLTFERLRALGARYVFFPHWSHLIPAEIYENFECVIFHMTDVPFGRGGTPLQNLISRKIYQTQVSALRCIQTLDGGPVYLKRPLSLFGSAEEIYLRAAQVIEGMISQMIRRRIAPKSQRGRVVLFKRRQSEESNLMKTRSLVQVFDWIRMLDAEGYPRAFLDVGRYHLEFRRASLKAGRVMADVTITEKKR